MPKRYIRGDKVISNTTPPPVLLVLRRKPPTPLDSYSPQGAGRRQYRQKMPRWCSAIERPNITGGIDQNIQSTTVENDFRIQGAFGQTQTTKGAGGDGNNNAWALSNLRFCASDSSSLYSSNTVQPKALQTLIIIKVWIEGGWTVSLPP